MTTERTISADQVKKLHQIENLALFLDAACKVGEIDDEKIEKAQDLLNKVGQELIADSEIVGSRLYVVYEAQAILHWINKNENDAYDFVQIALNTKGDSNLLTSTASDLLGDSNNVDNKKLATNNKKLVGVHGWLWWITLGIGVSILTISYSEFQVLSAASNFTAFGWGWYVYFCSIVNFALIAMCIAYLVQISKESVLAKKIGMAFFAFSAITMLADAAITSSLYSYSNMAQPSDLWNDSVRACIMAMILIPYFLKSKRVKATLRK